MIETSLRNTWRWDNDQRLWMNAETGERTDPPKDHQNSIWVQDNWVPKENCQYLVMLHGSFIHSCYKDAGDAQLAASALQHAYRLNGSDNGGQILILRVVSAVPI